MSEHAEVSPKDWIALFVPRNSVGATGRPTLIRALNGPSNGCICCCDRCPPSGPPSGTPAPAFENNSIEFENNAYLNQLKIKKQKGYITKTFKKNSFLQFVKNKLQKFYPQNIPKYDDEGNLVNPEDTINFRLGSGGATEGPCAETWGPGCPGWIEENNCWQLPGVIAALSNPDIACGLHAPTLCKEGVFNPDDPKHIECEARCCNTKKAYSKAFNSEPIVFAYKYSGCNFYWYPREYSFDYDPYITQCTSFANFVKGPWAISCHPKAWLNDINYPGAPSSSSAQSGCFESGNELIRTDTRFPCYCSPYPHIHGGVKDGVEDRINVSLKEGQLGYLASSELFAPPMEASDIDCCWCANTNRLGSFTEQYYKNRQACFRNIYPAEDGRGRTIGQGSCSPGANCYTQSDLPGLNLNYRRRCWNRGISPYLLRKAKVQHKMAYQIWGHGSDPDKTQDFGPYYKGIVRQIGFFDKRIVTSFGKQQKQNVKLRNQLIGIVGLSHHFEAYAYRSEAGSRSIEILPLQNSCLLLIGQYEGYGGILTPRGPSTFRYNPFPHDSLMWQVRRGVPRRAMYNGSTVPLFHFDLVNMEAKSINKGIVGPDNASFDGKKFLEYFYEYFYTLRYYNVDPGCENVGDIPGAPEWDFSGEVVKYQYVSFWLEKMVEESILRIKDHAIDISEEVNHVIRSGIEDPETKELILSDEIALEVNGEQGYRDLCNFFSVSPGTLNATTPKIIRQKLFNPESLTDNYRPTYNESWVGPAGVAEELRCFLPRRAVLPVGLSEVGVTAWGFTGSHYGLSFAPLMGITLGITGADYYQGDNISDIPQAFDVPNILKDEEYLGFFSPQKISLGLAGGYIIDASGKLIPVGFGNISLATAPQHLSIGSIYDGGFDDIPPELKDPGDVPDGNVLKVEVGGLDYAVAMVEYLRGHCPQYTDKEFPPSVGGDCNGDNFYVNSPFSYCAPNYPFGFIEDGSSEGSGSGLEPVGPRAFETRPSNAFRLVAWGSPIGVFSLASTQVSVSDSPDYCQDINPDDKIYPGTNAWNIWTDFSVGIKHTVAIDDYGGLFATPLSDNTYNQSSKGMGQSELIPVENFNGPPVNWNGRINYFPHIPRPGYVKEEEWNQQFYYNVTLPNSCYRLCASRCPYLLNDNGILISCRKCGGEQSGPGGDGGGVNSECADCDFTFKIKGALHFGQGTPEAKENCPDSPTGCTLEGCYTFNELNTPSNAREINYDLTPLLLGKFTNWKNHTDPGEAFQERMETFEPDPRFQPAYTKVAAGHYNTLCVTNENRVEIYGTYGLIDQNGEMLPGTTFDVFVPNEIKALAGRWNVTYGDCEIFCKGATHSPIIDATYTNPSFGNNIEEIKSSCDYSVCITEDKSIHIWGDASMVPDAFNIETYKRGKKAYKRLRLPNAIEIVSFAVGANSFYVHYRQQIAIGQNTYNSYRTYSYTRYGIEDFGTEVPAHLFSAVMQDIGAGYAHAMALVSTGLEAKTWKAGDFAEDTLKYQFANFESLPFYFRRQAFFHAVPGSWDYSKFLYGGVCCRTLEGGDFSNNPDNLTQRNPVTVADRCSALAYNIYRADEENQGFDPRFSFSGHPELFWMRPDWRRFTYQSSTVQNEVSIKGSEISCVPDAGINVPAQQGGIGAISFYQRSCLGDYGDCWGEGRPQADRPPPSEIRSIPSCVPSGNCGTSRWNNPAALPGNAIQTAIPVPVKVSFRSTKDVLQASFVRFDAPSRGCMREVARSLSYFKYAERHYYFGYDDTTGVYGIYNNPDFLREIAPLVYNPEKDYVCVDADGDGIFQRFPLVGEGEEDPCLGFTAPYPVGCTLCGFGGGNGPNGEGLCGSSAYLSLFNYALSGPNYGSENAVEWPIFSITDPGLVAMDLKFQSQICDVEDGPQGCSLCGGGAGGPNRNPLSAVVGYGAVAFVACGFECGPIVNEQSGEIVDGYCVVRGGEKIKPGGAIYYNRGFKAISPSRALLWGVDQQISYTIPPENDTNYQNTKKTFIDVLNDSEYTHKTEPWFFSNSPKWKPMFYYSPLIEGSSNTNDPEVIALSKYNLLKCSQDGPQDAIKCLSNAIDANADCGGCDITSGDPFLEDGVFVEEIEFDTLENPIREHILGKFTSNTELGVRQISKGVFKYEISATKKNPDLNVKFGARLYKVDQFGTETLLLNDSDYSPSVDREFIQSVIEDPGDPNSEPPIPPTVTIQETPTFGRYIFNQYVTMPIEVNETDKLRFELYAKVFELGDTVEGGSNRLLVRYGTVTDVPEALGDEARYVVGDEVSFVEYSKFSIVLENPPCFGGGDDTPNAPPSNVKKVVTDQGQVVYQAGNITCLILDCCGA
jgi:hypothetical protein